MTSVRKTLITDTLLVRSSGKVYRWARGDLFIDGDRIAAIEAPGTIPRERADAIVDGARLLVMPGLINGHMHSWDHYLKGCLENLTTEVAMSLIRPRKAVALTPRQMYLRTVVGALESLRTGATTIVDDLSLGQLFSREHIDAAFQAYEDTGTRAFVGFSMIDRAVVDSYPFGEAEFPPALLSELRGLKRPTADQLLGLVRDLAAKGKHPKSARVATLVSPSAPHRCTDGFLVASRKLADELDLPVMTHCQETRMQLITAEEFYGRSLVAHLDHLGFLKENTSLIHATWLSKRDIEIIARSGASVQYNPWSNAIMGSGVAPLRALLDAGINVSMGSDGCGLLYGVNMLNTLGTGAVIPKIASPDSDNWPTAEDIYRAGCEGGAKAFGLADQLGKIEPGFKADLVCYDLDATTLTPLNHPVRQIVYGERGAAIREVFVDGRHVLREGRNTMVNETALLREMQAAHAELGDTLVSSQEDAAPFHDALMRVYLRALSCPIASDHYAALMTGNNIAGQTPNA